MSAGLPIEELKISTRAKNVLYSESVFTVGELVQLSAANLLRFPNCGRSTVKEIMSELFRLHLNLNEDDCPRKSNLVSSWPGECDFSNAKIPLFDFEFIQKDCT